MAKKTIIIDGVTYDLGADAENVDYTNASMQNVSNVDDALDHVQGKIDTLDGRVDAVENPQPTVTEYTEADCTEDNKRVYVNGSLDTNSNCKSSGYIDIPLGGKIYIKLTGYDYESNWGAAFYGYKEVSCYPQASTYDDEDDSDRHSFVSKVVSIEASSEYTEIPIPDNAIAFRFTHKKSNASYHTSVKIVVDRPVVEGDRKLKVASWNIGHFSKGKKQYSTITDETVDAMRIAYRKVFDAVSADFLCLSEFDEVFNSDAENSTPQSEILGNYPFYKIGEKHDFNCNAVFSRYPILATQELRMNKDVQYRYIKETTIRINGKLVKVVTAHFDETSNYVTQLQEIISYYADDPYVIIGADFNIHRGDTWGHASGAGSNVGYLNYQYLTDAGYTLINYDYLNIDNPLSASTADNIAVKGFAMGKREYIYEENVSENLSDHCMVACELVML